MSNHPVQITLPDHLYDRARKAAEEADQPIEDVLIKRLEASFSTPLPPLPPDEQAELDALVHLSDEALWTIVHEVMPKARQQRLQTLMDGNTQGSLTDAEQEELAVLVHQSERLILRKAQSGAILAERGHHPFDDTDTRDSE